MSEALKSLFPIKGYYSGPGQMSPVYDLADANRFKIELAGSKLGFVTFNTLEEAKNVQDGLVKAYQLSTLHRNSLAEAANKLTAPVYVTGKKVYRKVLK